MTHLTLRPVKEYDYKLFPNLSPFAMIDDTTSEDTMFIIEGKMLEINAAGGLQVDRYEIHYFIDNKIGFQNDSGKQVEFTFEVQQSVEKKIRDIMDDDSKDEFDKYDAIEEVVCGVTMQEYSA